MTCHYLLVLFDVIASPPGQATYIEWYISLGRSQPLRPDFQSPLRFHFKDSQRRKLMAMPIVIRNYSNALLFQVYTKYKYILHIDASALDSNR